MKQITTTSQITRTALAGLLIGSLALPVMAQNDNASYNGNNNTNYNRTYNANDSYSGIDVPSSRREIAAGTEVKVKLLQDVTSETAHVGDTVRAQVDGDSNGLPSGTMFTGRVTAVHPATSKDAGSLRIQFGRGTGVASASLAGKSASGDKSNYTSIGAGVGALGGFIRKRKLGDAIGGAILGGAAGYGANQLQKHNSSDVSLKKGDTMTVKLDRPVTLRTQVVQPY